MSKLPAGSAVVRCPMRLGGVFHDPHPRLVGKLPDGPHVGALPVQVDGHERGRPLVQCADHVGWVDAEVAIADVGEAGDGADLEDRVQCGDERERAGDDLITVSDTDCLQGRDERGRTVVHGDGVAHSGQLGELRLQPAHHRTLCDPP